MKKKFDRVFLIVLDSVGIGGAPDAALYSDLGANTLRSLASSGRLNIHHLISLGLGNIDGVDCVERADTPLGVYAALTEKSRGKDTTVGHWEMMGQLSPASLPTYPSGFPEEIISRLESAFGRRIICNRPYSGTEVIRDYGQEHVDSGALIVYTSADSVLQIAAHEEVVPTEELYEYCRRAREIMTGKHGVGRIIARPFATVDGEFKRTDRRRDFSLAPGSDIVTARLAECGKEVRGIGKISDIFAGVGITHSTPTHGNSEGISALLRQMDEDFHGLVFLNLVDFDMLYGHRQDVSGYTEALNSFDTGLGQILEGLRDGDLLIITADHGCDPADNSTDHTRERVPLVVYAKGIVAKNLGTHHGFDSVGALVCRALGITPPVGAADLYRQIDFTEG